MRKVALVVTWWSSMLWSGRITLVVMISAMVLTHSSAEEEPIRKPRSTFLSRLVPQRRAGGNSIRHSKSMNRCLKTHRNWDMEPVIVKLNTVYDRYEFSWRGVKALYAPVEPCMPDRCGKSHSRKLGMPKGFNCAKFKRRKDLREKIMKILSRFHSGVYCFIGRFQNLISLLKGSSGRRFEILNDFKNDLKMLNIEIETLLRKKRLKTKKKRLATPLSSPGTLAYLKNEFVTLHDSKKFLDAWKKNLSNVFTCWNKMNGTSDRASTCVNPAPCLTSGCTV